MDIVQLLWLLILLVLSSVAYLAFAVISHDAIASFTAPPERKREDYELSPLTRLYPDPQSLIAILNFSRLLFAIPVLLLAYQWASQAGTAAGVMILVAVVLLLYLLPRWLLRQSVIGSFRSIVQVITYVLYPLFWVMSRPAPPRIVPETVTAEEKNNHAEQAEEESQEFKGDILRAISMIEEVTVREVMTPRVDMICVEATATLEELHQLFKDHKFSRLPVYKDKIDNMVGIVGVMEFVAVLPSDVSSGHVSDIMRPVLFVPESKKVFTLLREFRESHAQMAVVIDEYGGISGLVTLEDLLEEIVGDIEDEYDEQRFDIIPEKDGSYIVSGKLPVERLEETFNVKVTDDDFETISGLVFSVLGRIPLVGEIVRYQNLHLEVLEADKRRIHRLRVRELPQEQKKDAEEVV